MVIVQGGGLMFGITMLLVGFDIDQPITAAAEGPTCSISTNTSVWLQGVGIKDGRAILTWHEISFESLAIRIS